MHALESPPPSSHASLEAELKERRQRAERGFAAVFSMLGWRNSYALRSELGLLERELLDQREFLDRRLLPWLERQLPEQVLAAERRSQLISATLAAFGFELGRSPCADEAAGSDDELLNLVEQLQSQNHLLHRDLSAVLSNRRVLLRKLCAADLGRPLLLPVPRSAA
jgi:S-adenosylmethionine:diacylglycerol 3-amino-3-carboxypropyl transferase